MDIPHHLIEQIRAGKTILFLGAGASFGATSPTPPISPPSGKDLSRLLSDKFLLLRPDEVLSGIPDAPVLEVA
ncbi:hypothetical protein, partial [Candidatus Propionivibrio aalborgensis]|uniref:hypothetical protein n=1 Tax=Candidatus Propionivibrio aalborgensis TaxID=1860101 RepID=UPI001C900E2A